MRATVAVALLFAAVCAHAQGGGPPAPRWQRFNSYDGSFSFSMPGQPAYKTQMLKAKNGRPVRYTTYTVDVGRSAYMASTSDYDSETHISLDGAIDGVLSSWENPRMIDRRRGSLYGYPGQIVDFISGKYRVVVRAFVVGKRLYQLGFTEVSGDFVPSHVDRFMQSFQLR
jgi:hypothetical protein